MTASSVMGLPVTALFVRPKETLDYFQSVLARRAAV